MVGWPLENSPGHVFHVHGRLDGELPARLGYTVFHPGGHLGSRISDIDLTASDVVLPAIQGR